MCWLKGRNRLLGKTNVILALGGDLDNSCPKVQPNLSFTFPLGVGVAYEGRGRREKNSPRKMGVGMGSNMSRESGCEEGGQGGLMGPGRQGERALYKSPAPF